MIAVDPVAAEVAVAQISSKKGAPSEASFILSFPLFQG
jgi:hypothetical protein